MCRSVALTLAPVLFLLAAGCNPRSVGAAQVKIDAELTPDTSVVVAPLVLAGRPMHDAVNVVGLMLEQEGMPNVWSAGAEFQPAEGADIEQVAAAFGQWAAAQGFKQECALLGQVLGTRETGVTEIRIVLVDAAGKVLWTDRQTPEDKAFQRVKPRDPMSSCVLITERLRPLFHLTAATRGRVKDGRQAAEAAAHSGLPDKAELAAMEPRLAALKAAPPNASLRVYSVQTIDGPNAEHAAALAARLSKDAGLHTAAAGAPLEIALPASSNEQRRLWALAHKFRAHVRAEKPDADYALIAEYLIRPQDKQVWSVHFVICDRAGEWVIVDYQNNHHDDFNAIDPKSADDCAALIARRLKGYLR